MKKRESPIERQRLSENRARKKLEERGAIKNERVNKKTEKLREKIKMGRDYSKLREINRETEIIRKQSKKKLKKREEIKNEKKNFDECFFEREIDELQVEKV